MTAMSASNSLVIDLYNLFPGYACLSLDGAGIRRVRSALTAGDAPTQPLMSGECARINTGASLPCGADCVVQVTDVNGKFHTH